MEIVIKTSSETKDTITVDPSETVEQVKKKVEQSTQIPAGQQKLIFAGRILKDHDTVETTGLKSGSTIHVVKTASAAPVVEQSVLVQPASPSNWPANPPNDRIPYDPELIHGLLSNPGLVGSIERMIQQHPELLGMAANMRYPPELDRSGFNHMAEQLSNPAMLEHFRTWMEAFSATSAPIPPPQEPEVEYKVQLEQLEAMGFYSKEENIQALVSSRGNVPLAVDRLLAKNPL